MINKLKELLERKDKDIKLLEDNERYIKNHAQKAGTEMHEWKKKAMRLEENIRILKEEFETFKLRTLQKLEEDKGEKNDRKSKSKSTKNTRSTKQKR